MKRFFLILFSIQVLVFPAYGSNLIREEKLSYLTKDDIKKIWETNHIPQLFLPVNNGVSIFELSYYTTWFDGAEVKAAGYVFIPDHLTLNPATLLYHHGTRIPKKGNTKVGANEFGICAGFAADGYIVVMPEYVGLGNGDKYQLYLHAKTESSASADMLDAARDFVQKNYSATIHDIYITGYSQGGHAALATQAMLEKDKTDSYHVVASAPMSGPYDMSGTLPKSFDMQYTSPALFVFMLKSYQEIYGLRPDFSEVLRKPYDSLCYVYLDGINNYKAYNAMLPQKAVDVVTASFFDEDMHSENSVFMKSLKENDVYRFVSKAPIQYCYCADDETVDPRNTWTAYNWMKNNGVKKVSVKNGGENLDHEECAIFALMHTKLFFDKYRYPQRSNFKNDFSNISLNLIIAAKKAFPKLNLSF